MKVIVILIFVSISSNVIAQNVNIGAYEYQTSFDCIENWTENQSSEYIGDYSFVHFGTDMYTIRIINGTMTIDEHFMSLTDEESDKYTNVIINGNKISGVSGTGREFKARFVKLKCDVDSQILKGFRGLLIDEESLYLLQGD